ncbi:hypothetical protein B296_00012629 [Ensete ventricosum]|uniref:Uncharacterized protein n=1 Tax=Ensete ventricosum TaxID=4639 RepID=A0A426ZAC0_ENSVE|nr:hypothetical protein B296_00012629 [Ensete ventricosum]
MQLPIAPALSLPCHSTSPAAVVIAPSAAYSHNRDPTIRLPSRITVAKLVLYIGKTKKKRKANKILKNGKGKERPSKTNVAKKDLAKDKGQCFHYGKDGH